MAGCISCFIVPLLLFLFHRFIQPIILKFWNPWESNPLEGEKAALECLKTGQCKRKDKSETLNNHAEENNKTTSSENAANGSPNSRFQTGDTCKLRS